MSALTAVPGADQAALRAAVRAGLGDLSVPETITGLPEVPVAVSGKPDKAALLRLLGYRSTLLSHLTSFAHF